MPTAEGALVIHANGKLLFEATAEGQLRGGEQFDELSAHVWRALSLQYPAWIGATVAAYVRAMPPSLSSQIAVSAASGQSLQMELTHRIYRAVLEEVALRAEMQGSEAAVALQKHQEEIKEVKAREEVKQAEEAKQAEDREILPRTVSAPSEANSGTSFIGNSFE